MKTISLFNLVHVFGCVAAMLIFAGCKQAGPPSGTAGTKEPPEVGFVAIKQQQVALTTELTGRVLPQMVAEIRPQVGGIIKKRLF